MINRFVTALFLCVIAVAPAAAQNDSDTKEVMAYRLTMAGVNKLNVAMRSVYEEMKSDPRVLEMKKIEADAKALSEKEELTEADEARLAALMEKKEKLEDSVGGMNVGNEKTLADMEAKVKTSPVMMRALGKAGLTPREYAKMSLAMVTSAMYAGMQKAGLLKELPKEASPENVKFILDHEAELTAMQKEWALLGKDIK